MTKGLVFSVLEYTVTPVFSIHLCHYLQSLQCFIILSALCKIPCKPTEVKSVIVLKSLFLNYDAIKCSKKKSEGEQRCEHVVCQSFVLLYMLIKSFLKIYML